MKIIIYKTTFEAVKYSHLVNHLSSRYFQVSDKYQMNWVSSLGKLLLIEGRNEIQRAQLELTNNCENTMQQIKMLIQDHAKDFQRRIPYRMDAIETEYDAVRIVMSLKTWSSRESVKLVNEKLQKELNLTLLIIFERNICLLRHDYWSKVD